MAPSENLKSFLSTVCVACFDTFQDHPEHRLLFARSGSQDESIPSVSFDPDQSDEELNAAIRRFFDGAYQFAAMAQHFPWEEEAVIGWVKRKAWLVAGVERNGDALICVSYNDTDQATIRAIEDPPMLGFDNAGFVRGWIEGRPQPLTKEMPSHPRVQFLSQNSTVAVAQRARNQ